MKDELYNNSIIFVYYFEIQVFSSFIVLLKQYYIILINLNYTTHNHAQRTNVCIEISCEQRIN